MNKEAKAERDGRIVGYFHELLPRYEKRADLYTEIAKLVKTTYPTVVSVLTKHGLTIKAGRFRK